MRDHGAMSKPPDRVEQILDVVLYAPLGALLTIAQTIPTLAERGRRDMAEATGALAKLRDRTQYRR